MNTLHFKYAVEVERTGSISQAAENLYMAQPNLSKAIREMEDSLGITIFERTSKGAVPTQEGREFLGYAKTILAQIEKMETIHIPRTERQTLKVSIARGSYLANGFSRFVGGLDLTKHLDLQILETNSMQTIDHVVNDNFNFGVVRYQDKYENYFLDYLKEKQLASEILWSFECLVLLSKDHPLAKKERLDYAQLHKTSVEIVHGDNVIPYLPAKEARQDCCQKRIFVYERGSQFDLLCHVPQTFMWVSPVPQELCDRYDLVQRRCAAPNNHFKDVLVYAREYTFSDLERSLINCFYEEKNAVSLKNYL